MWRSFLPQSQTTCLAISLAAALAVAVDFFSLGRRSSARHSSALILSRNGALRMVLVNRSSESSGFESATSSTAARHASNKIASPPSTTTWVTNHRLESSVEFSLTFNSSFSISFGALCRSSSSSAYWNCSYQRSTPCSSKQEAPILRPRSMASKSWPTSAGSSKSGFSSFPLRRKLWPPYFGNRSSFNGTRRLPSESSKITGPLTSSVARPGLAFAALSTRVS
mmetsp:Transcript_46493/g.140864  ORF Transcript_46493/g.140864 Transcript_46493/m.140864 type:complete len:224 (+) Transcript_46493:1691-2362(+)